MGAAGVADIHLSARHLVVGSAIGCAAVNGMLIIETTTGGVDLGDLIAHLGRLLADWRLDRKYRCSAEMEEAGRASNRQSQRWF